MSNLLQTHNVTILTRRKAHTQSMQASIQIKVKQIARSNQIKVKQIGRSNQIGRSHCLEHENTISIMNQNQIHVIDTKNLLGVSKCTFMHLLFKI
jgi:hypothetical protein